MADIRRFATFCRNSLLGIMDKKTKAFIDIASHIHYNITNKQRQRSLKGGTIYGKENHYNQP